MYQRRGRTALEQFLRFCSDFQTDYAVTLESGTF